jgi:hypothetical protein
MTRTNCNPKSRQAARAHVPVALGLVSLTLGACNSLLGISTPVEIPADAASDSLVTVLVDAGPDGADARVDAPNDVGRDGADATPDSADATPDSADGGPDASDAGSDADASPPPPLVITPATLPDARFNVPYSVKFTAMGGTGAEQRWTMTSGALPPGLDLELDGTLHGVPVQEGVFALDVAVSELPPGIATATEHLTLIVVRKHWLAYLANPQLASNFGIFAIDIRSPNAQVKVSTNIPATTGSVERFDFSPDGKYLAYLGYPLAMGFDQLYVVDMTGDTPGTPRKVNEYGAVDDFTWSPDGRYLAFDDQSEGDDAILVADMTQPQSHPVQAATGTGNLNGLGFVTDDLLTYWLDNLAYTRRSADGTFGAAQLLTIFGAPVQRWPDLESALFASNGENCQDPTWSLIDFRTPLIIRQLVGYVSVSPGRDFVAHRQNPDYQYVIYSAWGTDPLTTFSTASHFCSPGGWSHDGSLFVAGGDDDTLQITRIAGATATTSPLPGSYGTVAENGPPRFSADDRWLGFSSNQGAFVVRNNHGSLGAAMGGGVPVNAEFGEPRISFSPDSTFMASGEAGSTDRAASLRVMDLRQDPPATTTLSLQGTTAGSAVNALGWSADSSSVAFIVRDTAFPSPIDLYLESAAAPNPPDLTQVNMTKFPPCDLDSTTCRIVTAFEFQP